jgi:nicotinamide-nucleotide amidase
MDDYLHQLSQHLGEKLRERNWRIATAESCTGGGVAAAITAIPGSSAWFEYGIVSYANAAKEKLLGVSSETLARHGAVSEAVVIEMARGGLTLSGADIAVAISGVAGPSGGSHEKPVGTVWFAWARAAGEIKTELKWFDGDREAVQKQAVVWALEKSISALIDSPAEFANKEEIRDLSKDGLEWASPPLN